MCDHHVIKSVKDKMTSKETVKKASFKLLIPNSVPDSTPSSHQLRTFTDLTHTLHNDFPTFSGEQQYFMEPLGNWETHKCNFNEIRFQEHTGTHIDAPLHFSENGNAVDQIPINNLIVPIVVVDIKAKAAKDPDAQLTPGDVNNWIKKHGPLPDNCCVAMNSGWSEYVNTDKFRNADQNGVMHFPGFHEETALMLLESGLVVGIAVDTLSLDRGLDLNFPVHYAWLSNDKWGLECIANLDALPIKGGLLIVGAPKHQKGSGGPCRVFSMV